MALASVGAVRMAVSTGTVGMPMREEATETTLALLHSVPPTKCRSLRLIPCNYLARHTPKITAAITLSGVTIVVHRNRRFWVSTQVIDQSANCSFTTTPAYRP